MTRPGFTMPIGTPVRTPQAPPAQSPVEDNQPKQPSTADQQSPLSSGGTENQVMPEDTRVFAEPSPARVTITTQEAGRNKVKAVKRSKPKASEPIAVEEPKVSIQHKAAPRKKPPTQGFPKLRWQFNLRFKIADPDNPGCTKVPNPNKKEREERDAQEQIEAVRLAEEARVREQQAFEANEKDRLARIEQARRHSNMLRWDELVRQITYLRALLDTGVDIRVLIAHERGKNHKTTTAVGLGDTFTCYGGMQSTIITATLATTRGDLGQVSGITEQNRVRAQISNVVQHPEKFDTTKKLGRNLPRTKVGSFLVSEDIGSDPNRPPLEPDAFFDMARNVDNSTPGPQILDGGNDGYDWRNFLFMLADYATVHCYVTPPDLSAAKGMKQTIYNLHSAPADFGREDQSPEAFVSIQDKIKHAVAITSGVVPGQTSDMATWLAPGGYPKEGEPPSWFTADWFEGQMQDIPFEPTLAPSQSAADGSKSEVKFNLFATSLETQQAFIELAIKVCEVAARLQHIDISDLQDIEPDYATASRLLGRPLGAVQQYMQSQKQISVCSPPEGEAS